jgi:hypothetical protein
VAARIDAKVAVLARDFPEPWTGVESLQLRQAAQLLDRSERTIDGDIAVRCANAAARLLVSLQNGRRSLSHEPLRERLAREFANDGAPA